MFPIDLLDAPDFRRKLDQCIHCGLCLSACPTYAVNQLEMDSPRGRIALMRGAADGRIGLEGAFQEHIDLCLGCRACETACPSGVQYGQLLETAKAALAGEQTTARRRDAETQRLAEEQRRETSAFSAQSPRLRTSASKRNGIADLIQRFGLRELMPRRDRLRWLARGLWLYQRLGLTAIAQWVLPQLPPALTTMEGMAPPIRLDYLDTSRPAPAYGLRRGKVAFFTGCVQDAFLAGVNRATVRVLQRNGYEVHFPRGQTCCNAAALHSGDTAFARDLARQNIDAFAGGAFVAIINNAGGCGASLKGYDHLLAEDPDYAERAQAFVEKVKDISEFLFDHLHNPPIGRVQARVTYVDSCHLRHGQKISKQPRALLRGIPGLELVELSQPDMCCGSAGIYNLLQPAMANEVLDRKLADVRATNAGIIVTANTGCYMQMVYGVKRAGLNATVMHVVEVLERAYANTM
jgi:glycolate oxidase iron-sulfur subunit